MSTMDEDSKMKVLRQLARTPGDVAISALEREAGKSLGILETDLHFDVLERQIELLGVFAFRVADRVVSGIAAFLSRLETIQLAHSQEGAWIEHYETPSRLAIASLELLSKLRYFETRDILGIAIAIASSSEDADVKKAAGDVLQQIAAFDIDAFYAGENRAGLGPAPQKVVIDFLESSVDLLTNIAVAARLCGYLLSPNMSGTSWNYSSVTWSSAAIPAIEPIADIRSRAIALLQTMFTLDIGVDHKKQILNAMFESTRLPDRGEFGDDLRQMISGDTTRVLAFLKQQLHNQPLPIVQKIEHDAYWRFYHAPTEEVRQSALEIEAAIADLNEYQIYRDLIGFEGIFQKWQERAQSRTEFRALEAYRSSKASEYAESIDVDKWPLWHRRILTFCETESDDLATFPRFYEFLEKLAVRQPGLALELLREDSPQIARFTIPLLRGLWAGPLQGETRDLVWGWISRAEHLIAVSKLFWGNENADEEVMRFLFDQLVATGDYAALSFLIAAALSNFAKLPELVPSIVLPAIEVLGQVRDTRWVNDVWFEKETRQWLAELDDAGRQIVLDGLVPVESIDYHTEEILIPLAEQDLAQSLVFFRKRIEFEDAEPEGSDYDAIPYSFHQLQNVLERDPKLVVDVVLSWFREPIDLFQFRGGKLLKAIFPSFPRAFAEVLSYNVQNGDREQIDFVLDVLRNYEGEPFLYGICRDILVKLPTNDVELLGKLEIVLRNTGVVHGEFGFAEAYEQKAKAVEEWLSDPDDQVRIFAERFTKELRQFAEEDRRRAREEIRLRKHRFGIRDAKALEEGQADGDGVEE
ncbi:hypothetical protein Rleg9DRAFT_1919 [Rhizobium leguminosarum bv. trifolii WSM597]|uniref:Uncharacterized protein n=1 Tax=Rhizobium leguminosarum bv. trifolii WSM597 TaxID=754764 RepID=I9N597_RHILT|nr:hypothetical protein [Rhizobium leguminosarum]EJB03094.1 hypothetical protein Rleg9DRAFT_1919 [Rhizobium leguminosarum bv. trifolii WSM597]